jgi:hypothetical protein
MPTLKEIKAIDAQYAKKQVLKIKYEEHLAAQEMKREETARAKAAELDTVQRYREEENTVSVEVGCDSLIYNLAS